MIGRLIFFLGIGREQSDVTTHGKLDLSFSWLQAHPSDIFVALVCV